MSRHPMTIGILFAGRPAFDVVRWIAHPSGGRPAGRPESSNGVVCRAVSWVDHWRSFACRSQLVQYERIRKGRVVSRMGFAAATAWERIPGSAFIARPPFHPAISSLTGPKSEQPPNDVNYSLVFPNCKRIPSCIAGHFENRCTNWPRGKRTGADLLLACVCNCFKDYAGALPRGCYSPTPFSQNEPRSIPLASMELPASGHDPVSAWGDSRFARACR